MPEPVDEGGGIHTISIPKADYRFFRCDGSAKATDNDQGDF
jgi:hypothetical protein